jgi:hypothetical protein
LTSVRRIGPCDCAACETDRVLRRLVASTKGMVDSARGLAEVFRAMKSDLKDRHPSLEWEAAAAYRRDGSGWLDVAAEIESREEMEAMMLAGAPWGRSPVP